MVNLQTCHSQANIYLSANIFKTENFSFPMHGTQNMFLFFKVIQKNEKIPFTVQEKN